MLKEILSVRNVPGEGHTVTDSIKLDFIDIEIFPPVCKSCQEGYPGPRPAGLVHRLQGQVRLHQVVDGLVRSILVPDADGDLSSWNCRWMPCACRSPVVLAFWC